MLVLALAVAGNVYAGEAPPRQVVWPVFPMSSKEIPRITATLPLPDGGIAVMAANRDKRGVIYRLDKNGKELWHQAWLDGTPVQGVSRIAVLPTGKLLLADGNGSFANISGEGGTVISIPVSSVWTEPLRFFHDGGIVVACGYFDQRDKAIPCIDRLRADGSRLWLWHDRDFLGDGFIHAIAPRVDGGAVAVIGSVSSARANLFPQRLTAKDHQSVICLDQTGTKVGSISLAGFMLPIDTAQTPGGMVLVVGRTTEPEFRLRVLAISKEGCAITLDRTSDFKPETRNPPTWGRLLIPDDGSVYLALSVKDEGDEMRRSDAGQTFLASIASDGALSPQTAGVRGILPSISADGKELWLVEHGEVRGYSLDALVH